MLDLSVPALVISGLSVAFTALSSRSARTQVRHAREQADAAFYQVLIEHLRFEAHLEGDSGTYQLFVKCVVAPGGRLASVIVTLPAAYYSGYGVGITEGLERDWGPMAVTDERWMPVVRNLSPKGDGDIRVEVSWRPPGLDRGVHHALSVPVAAPPGFFVV